MFAEGAVSRFFAAVGRRVLLWLVVAVVIAVIRHSHLLR
jgi:hypothetical protein